MCTVSFVLLSKDHFILTSNRDETTERGLASAPVLTERKNYSIACPVDPMAHGTWIAASNSGDVICLLNGAFKKHKRILPYRMSRGQVVLDYFETDNPEKFAAEYDLNNIEPFTLVMLHRSDELQLFELRWDANEKYFRKLNENEFHLWSSATLYSNELMKEKEIAFRNYLSEPENISPELMISIHQKFLYEAWVKPPQRVEVVSTLSVTSVESNRQSTQMYYRDLIRKQLPLETLTLLHAEKETDS